MTRQTIAALIALAAFAGCATSTQIISEPPGAKVYDSNGTELGTTPYTYESEMWLWESEELELRKSGYKNATVEMKRSEIDVMPTVGSAALFVCLGFVPFGLSGVVLFLAGGMKFPDETKVSLDRSAAPAEAAPPAEATEEEAAPVSMMCPAPLSLAMVF